MSTLKTAKEINEEMVQHRIELKNKAESYVKKIIPKIVSEIEAASRKLEVECDIKLDNLNTHDMTNVSIKSIYTNEFYKVLSPLGYNFAINLENYGAFIRISWGQRKD